MTPRPSSFVIEVAPNRWGRRRVLNVLSAKLRSRQITLTLIQRKSSGTVPKQEGGDQPHALRFKKIEFSYSDEVTAEATAEANFSSAPPRFSGSARPLPHRPGGHGARELRETLVEGRLRR